MLFLGLVTSLQPHSMMDSNQSRLNPNAVNALQSDDAVAQFGMKRYIRFDVQRSYRFSNREFTISFWLRPSASGTLLFYGDRNQSASFNATESYLELRVNGSSLEIGYGGGDVSVQLPRLEDGRESYYVAMTYEQSMGSNTGRFAIYLNEAPPIIGTLQLANGNGQPMYLPASGRMYIGSSPPNQEGRMEAQGLYAGTITELRIWSKILRGRGIERNAYHPVYGDEAGLFLALPLDSNHYERSSHTFEELTGKVPASNIALYDAPAFLYSTDIRDFPVQNRTLEMWARCGFDTGDMLVSYGDYSNSHDHMNEGTNPWSLSLSDFNSANPEVTVRDGQWHHLAVVSDSTQDTIFLDGVALRQRPRSEMQLPNQILVLGARNTDSTDNVFNGQIRDVFLWRHRLSADDLSARSPDQTLNEEQRQGVVLHWPLVLNKSAEGPSPSYGNINQLDYVKDTKPLSRRELWRYYQRISSRSSLTEDYYLDNGQLKTRPVYRTSITVSAGTSYVDIWASEPATITIQDQQYQIDETTPYRAIPSGYSKIHLTMEANQLRCATLKLRTDLMPADQYHFLLADVEVHKKLVHMPDGTLSSQITREKLGIASQFSDGDLDDFQKGLKNLAKTVQHTYNKTTHGVHRDRALLPKNMEHPHFMLDFSDPKPQYVPLDSAGVRAVNGPITVHQIGFLAEARTALLRAEKIVIHTVKNVALDIVDLGQNVGHELVETVNKVGEDLVHGDIGDVGQDLMSGGENIGKALITEGGNIVEEAVSGYGQLLVLSLHEGETAVHYLLNHTGHVGRAIEALFERIKVKVVDAVTWLLDKIGWEDVKVYQQKFVSAFDDNMNALQAMITAYKQQGDGFLDELHAQLTGELKKNLGKFEQKNLQKPQQVIAQSHSGAMEKLEWVLSKFEAHHVEGVLPVGAETDPEGLGFVNSIQARLGNEGERLLAVLKQAGIDDIEGALTHPGHKVEYLLDFATRLAKAAAIFCLDVFKEIFDAFMTLAEILLNSFKTRMHQDYAIPLISELYKNFVAPPAVNGQPQKEMTFLDFTCLMVSIPTAIVAKAESSPASHAFDTRDEAVPLRQLLAPGWGYGYASCHMALGIIAPLADIKGFVSHKISQLNAHLGGLEQDWEHGAHIINPSNWERAKVAIDPGLALLNMAATVLAQVMGMPVPVDQLSTVMPPDATANNVYERPDYWSHIIWRIQWVGVGLNIIGTAGPFLSLGVTGKIWADRMGLALAPTNFVFGLIHLSFMALLDVKDREKAEGIDYCYQNNGINNSTLDLEFYTALQNSTPALGLGNREYYAFSASVLEDKGKKLADWVADIRNYYNWSQFGIPSKGFGNIMDAFPEVGQLGLFVPLVEDSKGYSIIATLGMDVMGHLGEGVTVMVRNARNEIV